MRLFKYCILGVLLGAVAVMAWGAEVGDTVRVATGEWPPFTSQKLPAGGPMTEIVSEAFALVGIRVEYGYFPWRRGYEYAKDGRWDGSIGWECNTPKHELDFVLSQPILVVDKVLYSRKESGFDWRDVGSLARWRLGAADGYSYGSAWDLAVKTHQISVETVPLDEQNLRKLLAGRVDVVAIEAEVATYLLATQFDPKAANLLVAHPKILTRSPICFALSRQTGRGEALMKRFNEGLQKLKASGRYAKILGHLNRAAVRGDQPRLR